MLNYLKKRFHGLVLFLALFSCPALAEQISVTHWGVLLYGAPYAVAMERGYFNPSVGKGLSWGAIIAGSVGAGALFIVLIALGTGLGLSISLRIVKDHQGEIEAAGTEGHGAVFAVRFPEAEPKSVAGDSTANE